MNRVLYYIGWMFDIRMYITGLITIIVSWMIEDWVRLKYGLDLNKGLISIIHCLFFMVLFFSFALIIEVGYKRFLRRQRSGYEIRKVLNKSKRIQKNVMW